MENERPARPPADGPVYTQDWRVQQDENKEKGLSSPVEVVEEANVCYLFLRLVNDPLHLGPSNQGQSSFGTQPK